MSLIRKLSWKDVVSVVGIIVFILFVQGFLIIQWRFEIAWPDVIGRNISLRGFYFLNMGFYLIAGLGLGLFIAWNNYYISWFKTWTEFTVIGSYGMYLVLSHPVFQFAPWNFRLYDTSKAGSALIGLELVLLLVRIIKLRARDKKDAGRNPA